MAATFVLADDDTMTLLANVRATYHPVLDEIGVRISVIMAVATLDKDGNPTGPALKDRGVSVMGRVRIRSHADRVQGADDAVIMLDGDRWAFLDRDRKIAALDRELSRLDVQFDDDGKPKVDDGGRPKLKITPFDYDISGFHAVLERHGRASIEQQQITSAVFDHYGQRVFDFFAVEQRVEAAS